MKKNNLLIELNRVNELMGTKQLISEQGGWVDDMVFKLVNISTRAGSKIPDLITALRNSQTIDEKSDNLIRLINQSRKEQNKEILKVIKVSLKETSELVYKQMIRNINNPKLSNAITKLKSEGKTEDEIVDILLRRQLPSTNDPVADDLLADEYARRMRKKVREVSQGSKPETTDAKIVNQRIGSSDKFKQIIDSWANKNIQTIRRVTTRIFKNQSSLNNEFTNLAKKALQAQMEGKKSQYYYKKMGDIMIAKNKSFQHDITELFNLIKKDPNIPKEIIRGFERSDVWQTIIRNVNKQTTGTAWESFKEPIIAYRKLLWPFGKSQDDLKSYISRLINFTLQLSPYTFEETVKMLQKKGVNRMIAQRMASSYFVKTIVLPVIFGTAKTIWALTLEGYEFINNLFGGDFVNTLGTGRNAKETWVEVLTENISNSMPKNYEWVIPFGTLLDEIWDLAKIANNFSSEKYVNDQDVTDTERIINDVKNNTQPTDTTTVNKTKDEPSKTRRLKDPFK